MNAKPSLGALAGAMLLAGQAQAIDCAGLLVWQSSAVYTGGNQVQHNDNAYQANYWTQNNNTEQFSSPWQHWSLLGSCDGAADPQPPYGSIASPGTNSTFEENDIAVISVAAGDGAVVAVEFFVDGIAIGTDSVAPWQMNWSAQVGNHSLTARIEDNDGLDFTTEPVPVSVSASDPDNPPAVSLTAPADGRNYDKGVSVALEATASDAEGPVARVEFYVGGVEVGGDTSAPFIFDWTAEAGSHSVYARVFDSADQFADSVPVSITVNGEPVTGDHPCRPDGLYTSPGTAPNYCDIYDELLFRRRGSERLCDLPGLARR